MLSINWYKQPDGVSVNNSVMQESCVSYRNVLKDSCLGVSAMTLHIQTGAIDLEFTALELLVKKLPQCGHWFMGSQCGKAEKPPLK